jgi:hypothetical protein
MDLSAPTIETERALRSLSETYARAADRRDPDRFAGVFLPDGLLEVFYPGQSVPRRHQGHAEIRATGERLSRFRLTMHMLGQSTLEIEGEEATGEVYCVAHHLDAEKLDTDYVMHIRYDDRYRAVGGRWGIVHRQVRTLWTETRTIDVPTSR